MQVHLERVDIMVPAGLRPRQRKMEKMESQDPTILAESPAKMEVYLFKQINSWISDGC